MKSRFFTLLGYTLATIAVITYLRVQHVPSISEAFDGIVPGLYFSGIFAIGLFGGLWIFAMRPANTLSPLLALMRGFNAGLISWLLIFLLWFVPWMTVLDRYAYIINSNLIFCVGVMMNKLPIYSILKDESEE